MANPEINNYITKRYYRWLDYAVFHCKQAGIPHDATDVVNEVLVSLLQKDTGKLLRMLRSEKDDYTELDWFVLRMLRLNIKSPTAPFQHKNYSKKTDCNVNVFKLQIEDSHEEPDDRPERLFNQMNAVRKALDDLCISENNKAIFFFRFFEGESFADWPGGESTRKLYDIYNQVRDLIKGKINGQLIF